MEGADDALTRMEGAVEQMLVDDMQRDAAREGVDASVKAYTEAQKPGLLEGLGMLLSFAGAFKEGLALLKGLSAGPAVEQFAASPGFIARTPPGPADPSTMLGLSVGAAGGTVGAVKGAQEVRRGGGDAVSGMAGALSGYIDSVQAGIGTLQAYVLGADMAAVGHAIKSALLDHETALDVTSGLGGSLTLSTLKRIEALTRELDTAADRIKSRTQAIARLVVARGPGAELAQGTEGRNTFDLVAANPGRFRLHRELELRVDVDDRQGFSTSIRPVSYWLQARDAGVFAKNEGLEGVLGVASRLGRPSFATDDMRRLPDDTGGPIATLLNATQHPPEQVRLVGPGGKEVVVSTNTWEDVGQRDRLLWRVVPIQRWEDGASSP